MRVALSVAVVLVGVGWGHSAEKGKQQQVKMPKDVRNHFQKLVGRWETKSTAGEEVSEGEWTARWAPGRTCLIIGYSGTLDGKPYRAAGVQGWDPLKERIQESHFTSEGMGTLCLSVKGPGVLEGLWTGVFKGKPATATDTFEWLGPDEWKITSKGELEAVLHAKRFSKEPRKKRAKKEE